MRPLQSSTPSHCTGGLTARQVRGHLSGRRCLWSLLPLTRSLPLPQDYIAVKEKYAKYLPHSAGRYAAKRFRKAQCPIVERLTNSMMMHGRNNGKKLMTVRIVKHAFEIIHLLTGEVGGRGDPPPTVRAGGLQGLGVTMDGSWPASGSSAPLSPRTPCRSW